MTATRLPKLTKIERDMLNHRLEIPECIAESIADKGYTEDEVCEAVAAIQSGAFDLSPIVCDVLADCVESSSWLSSSFTINEIGGESAAWRRQYKLCAAFAKKIGDLIGRELTYPKH